MKKLTYNRGSIQKTDAGTYQACINHAYKKYRATKATLELAKAWIDETMVGLDSQTGPLEYRDARDAHEAFALLTDHEGVTLTDAVKFYIQRHRTTDRTITIASAISQFLNEKQSAGLRSRSLTMLKSHLGRLLESFPEIAPADVTPRALIELLDSNDYKGTTRDGYRRSWRNFFSWSQRMGYVDHNPAEGITRARIDPTIPGILTVVQTRALLLAAAETDPKLAPYLVVGLFAGLRTSELMRITWGDIGDTIHVGAHAAKTRQQRFVEIEPNLQAWLKSYRPRPGRLAPWADSAMSRHLDKLRATAGITEWPHNAMRHSYATYHLAKYQNAPLTSTQLGHREPDTLWQHYRALARAKAGELYFSLTPSDLAKDSAKIRHMVA